MIHPEPDFESSVILSTNGNLSSNRSSEPGQAEMFSPAPDKKATRAKPKTLDGLKAPSLVGKNFVLDTNVLLHDPQCLRRFGDNHVCIPLEVLCELDRFKGEQTERGANARTVHRTLTELFAAHPGETSRGIPTHDGGSIRFVTCASSDRRVAAARERLSQLLPETDSADHRILLCAHVVDKVNSAPVVLVTKDLNMQLKALALGIPCEDYSSDKVDESSTDERRMRVISVDPHELQRFASAMRIHLVDDLPQDLALNEYVLLQVENGRSMPARYKGSGTFVRLRSPETICIQKGTPISPLNVAQECFLDALLDPSISLVTCYGQAGTGKTLLAVAAALHLTLNGGQYTGVTVSRPIVALGETLGFLPGSLEEKLNPWLQPIFDALEFILAKPQLPEHEGKRPQQPQPQKPKAKNARKAAAAIQPPVHGPIAKSYQRFLDTGVIEVEALCYIRGRSIPKRFFILDEAQQLTPLEAKTIVTRMAQGSKLILVGDPAQIDNAYVDRRSNGLVYTREKLKNQSCSAHITLERGERSPLAEAGARLM
jgi:PhoH-like ATPase